MGVISLNNHLSFFSLHSQQERDDSFVCLNTMKYFLPPTSRIMTDIKWLLVLWLLQSWVYTGFKYENWAGNCSSTHWCCNKYSNLNKFYCNMRKYDQRERVEEESEDEMMMLPSNSLNMLRWTKNKTIYFVTILKFPMFSSPSQPFHNKILDSLVSNARDLKKNVVFIMMMRLFQK